MWDIVSAFLDGLFEWSRGGSFWLAVGVSLAFTALLAVVWWAAFR
jgi:hypothetical protein